MPITTPSAPQSITAVTLNVTSVGTPATISQTFNDLATLASLKVGIPNSLRITNSEILSRYATVGLQCSNVLSVTYGGLISVSTPTSTPIFVATPITLSNFGPFNLDYVSGGTFKLPQPTSNSNSPGTFSYSVPNNNGVVSIALPGINWALRTSPASAANNAWFSVAYGNGLWVAVAAFGSGTGNRVMTSPDGINWTLRTSAADNAWRSVAYGNGLWVAVSNSGKENRVMTSPDGITWTSRTGAADNNWTSVAYGNGLWVAVGYSGTGNSVMTSPNGINWTIRTSVANSAWRSVAYGNGLWVAVAESGLRIMTSPDGINWTSRTGAAANFWKSVAYGNGLWVAVAESGSKNRVMTSPDGINWTIITSAADYMWVSVAYGNGLWVAVSASGTVNGVMTSGDSINVVGVGSSTITATQAATTNYSSGMISATFTVTQ